MWIPILGKSFYWKQSRYFLIHRNMQITLPQQTVMMNQKLPQNYLIPRPPCRFPHQRNTMKNSWWVEIFIYLFYLFFFQFVFFFFFQCLFWSYEISFWDWLRGHTLITCRSSVWSLVLEKKRIPILFVILVPWGISPCSHCWGLYFGTISIYTISNLCEATATLEDRAPVDDIYRYFVFIWDTVFDLTHFGLVMPYGNIDLGQHWLR